MHFYFPGAHQYVRSEPRYVRSEPSHITLFKIKMHDPQHDSSASHVVRKTLKVFIQIGDIYKPIQVELL